MSDHASEATGQRPVLGSSVPVQATWGAHPEKAARHIAAETAGEEMPRPFGSLANQRKGHSMGDSAEAKERRYAAAEELVTRSVARVAHEVNRAYCQALGDNSQPVWEEAPQWQRDSAMAGVRLHWKSPEAGPQASHESWMAQKVADGWVYGPEKRPDLKQHPCMVPFDQLPREQQAKDFIFRAVVHAHVHGPSETMGGGEHPVMRPGQ